MLNPYTPEEVQTSRERNALADRVILPKETWDRVLDTIDWLRNRVDVLEEGVADIYQVVGVLADAFDIFDHPDVTVVLDWLSNPSKPLDILPWPKTPLTKEPE